MTQNRRTKTMIKNKEKAAAELYHKTGGRVAMTGTPANRKASAVFYCHDCREFFWQNLRSLLMGFNSRCKCFYSFRADEKALAMARNTGGHRCLSDWESDGRCVPQKNPDVQSEGQEGVV